MWFDTIASFLVKTAERKLMIKLFLGPLWQASGQKLNFIYLQDFPALREHCLAVDFAWLAVFLIPRDHWKNVLVTSGVEQRWQLSYGAYLCPSADYGQPGCLPALSYYRLAFCRIDATLEIRKIGFRTKWFNGKTDLSTNNWELVWRQFFSSNRNADHCTIFWICHVYYIVICLNLTNFYD